MVQAAIDDSYRWFLGLVRQRRGLDAAAANEVGDGRILTGAQARALGLVDAIGGEREARAWLAAEREVPEDLPAVDVDVSGDDGLMPRLIGGVAGKLLNGEPLMLDGLLAIWQP